MAEHPLDNPVWHALTGPQASMAIGRGLARRYPRDVVVFSGIAAASEAAYVDLAADLPAGEDALVLRPTKELAPAGWEAPHTLLVEQMVLEPGALPAIAGVVRDLGPADAADMVELVALTKPGPFGLRTLELGGFVGVREPNGRLIAMAGERMRPPGYAEVSAIAVHPDARGRGLGALVAVHVARGVLARGEMPFLHVVPENPAKLLYARLGFRVRRTLWVVWRRRVSAGAHR